MKIYEIVESMSKESFEIGTIFQNEDIGDMVINEEGELI